MRGANTFDLSLTSNVLVTLEVINTDVSATASTNGQVILPITGTVMTPDATSVTAAATAFQATGTASPGPPTTLFSGLGATGSNSVTVAPINFMNYIGMGGDLATFTASASNGNYIGTGPQNLFFGGSATADSSLTTTHTYDTPHRRAVDVSCLASGVWVGLTRCSSSPPLGVTD